MGKNLAQNMLLGAVGGMAGAWTMNEFINFYHGSKKREKRYEQHSGGQKQKRKSTDRPASVQVAEKLAKPLLRRKLSQRELEIAGPALHLLFGGSLGIFYGLMRGHAEGVSRGQGAAFGVSVFVTADEMLMPLMGVSKSSQKYGINNHLASLLAHLVYGLTLESVCKLGSYVPTNHRPAEGPWM